MAGTVSTPVDSELRDFLREWRRTTAQREGVPAFVIMHDTSLEELCGARPRSLEEVRRVPGFGERKTQLYGPHILQAIQRFQAGARAAGVVKKQPKPSLETKALLAEGHTFEEIAAIRGQQVRTVMEAVANLVEAGDVEFDDLWVSSEKRLAIEVACERLGTDRLSPIKQSLPEDISYEDIRLVVAKVRCAATRAVEAKKSISAH